MEIRYSNYPEYEKDKHFIIYFRLRFEFVNPINFE